MYCFLASVVFVRLQVLSSFLRLDLACINSPSIHLGLFRINFRFVLIGAWTFNIDDIDVLYRDKLEENGRFTLEDVRLFNTERTSVENNSMFTSFRFLYEYTLFSVLQSDKGNCIRMGR